jgi:hypothetical protein
MITRICFDRVQQTNSALSQKPKSKFESENLTCFQTFESIIIMILAELLVNRCVYIQILIKKKVFYFQ